MKELTLSQVYEVSGAGWLSALCTGVGALAGTVLGGVAGVIAGSGIPGVGSLAGLGYGGTSGAILGAAYGHRVGQKVEHNGFPVSFL